MEAVVLLQVVLGVVVIVLLLSPLKLTPPWSIPIPFPRFRDRCVKERTTAVVKFIVRIIVSAVLYYQLTQTATFRSLYLLLYCNIILYVTKILTYYIF